MGSDGQKVQLDLEAVRAMTGACAYNATTLADALGVSGRHLRRLFMRELRCPPRTWLREERLQAARRLLSCAATVQEVAQALSFRNPSQFCRDFRARFGQTPSELKRRPGLLRRSRSAVQVECEQVLARLLVRPEFAAAEVAERDDVVEESRAASVLVEVRSESANRAPAPRPASCLASLVTQ